MARLNVWALGQKTLDQTSSDLEVWEPKIGLLLELVPELPANENAQARMPCLPSPRWPAPRGAISHSRLIDL